MLTALLSDIHGNLEALNACLGHARERGAERFGFLGDLVGYGADARGVVEVVARYAAADALVLKGNHDEAIEGGAAISTTRRAALQWARETLTQEQKDFLASLPLIIRHETVCFAHASAAAPERWACIDSPAAAKRAPTQRTLATPSAATCMSGCCASRTVKGAHDGVPAFSWYRDSGAQSLPWIGTAGSVGQPRDRDPAAAYTP